MSFPRPLSQDHLPDDHQELFEFAIAQRRSVIDEFYAKVESYRLKNWAEAYAAKHGLVAPADLEVYGI